jgi:hypothetical protein
MIEPSKLQGSMHFAGNSHTFFRNPASQPFRRLAHTYELEPIRSAIFPVQPLFAVCQSSSYTASALWRVGTVEEGDVLVTDIPEPISA